MIRRFSQAFLAITCLLVSACSSSEEVSEHHFSISERDGVTIAETTGGPKYAEELFEYEYLLTLQNDEREESLLFNPLGFHMDEKGWFYVNDSGNHRIAVFDSDGRYSHAIGREGQGPGEIQLALIQSVRNGAVTVMDVIQQRITRFDYDGILIDATRLPGGSIPSMPVTAYFFLPEDQRLTIAEDVDLANPTQIEDTAVRATVTDVAGDTLWTRRTPDVHVMDLALVRFMGQELPFPLAIPFGPHPAMDFHPDYGIVVSTGLAPELEFWNLDGEVQMHAKIEMVPEIPSDEERQSHIQSLRETQGDAPDYMKSLYDFRIENLRMPDAKAPWTEVDIDDSGFTWLMIPILPLMDAGASDNTTRSFRIISPEGEYLGNTTRPEGGAQSLAHGKILLQTSDPETGEYFLMVYRILPAVEGLEYP